ncbi:MAG: LysM peptidoglycan-binding domain-containing protein [Desulfobacteraceae bacterium]|nr:MAG: LysM peptidoglycan-binding domain-containing protein [Desulfobacteraceae bacterium]
MGKSTAVSCGVVLAFFLTIATPAGALGEAALPSGVSGAVIAESETVCEAAPEGQDIEQPEASIPENPGGVLIEESFTRDNTYVQRYEGRLGRWVRVKSGDCAGTVAKRYGTTVNNLLSINHLRATSKLYPNDFLFIPYTAAQAEKWITKQTVRMEGDSFIAPVDGRLTSAYGSRPWRSGKKTYLRFHYGIDLGAPVGTAIVAAKEGIVRFAGRYSKSYGNAVVLDHGNGVSSIYAHCSKVTVKSGDKVERGQTIALIGMTGRTTGPHVHFEVRLNQTAIDPTKYLHFDHQALATAPPEEDAGPVE